MREIDVLRVTEAVEELCIKACCELGNDVVAAYQNALSREKSGTGKEILKVLIKNAEIAGEKMMPLCQDTGIAVVFLEVGQDVHIVGGSLIDAVNEGVRRGYRKGYLRKSVVKDPFDRVNTGDNTPAVIHCDMVEGEQLKITVAPKGFGSENMSAVRMLKPAEGREGAKRFIIDVVDAAGPNPCPPVVVGVGIGGTMEKAALLAKKALLRPIGEESPVEQVRLFERELLSEINSLGIGPGGLGGSVTALAVNVEVYPTHIAGLPVAVNINCHAARHASIIL